MEPAVRALLTDSVHAGVAAAVGISPNDLRALGGFESFVYEETVRGAPRIVKATWCGRRTPEEMGAELHFVNYLADGGAPVSRAVPLVGGRLITSVPASEGEFHVCAFEKAPGAMLPRPEWTDAQVERWGSLVGCLHRLSTAYPGPPPPLRRPSWEEEYDAIGRFLEDEPEIQRRFQDLVSAIADLPREPGAFGAMHTDLHHHNIFWRDGEPHVFDFDDMLEFWFVSDLAIVLYYGAMDPVWHADDRQADYDRLRESLFRGYEREHALPGWSHEALPLFLALREHALRAVIRRSVPEADRSPFWKRFMVETTERILEGRPPLDLRI